MRPVTVRKSAAGVSPWIPIDRLARDFQIGLAVKLSSGANLTYSVQHTLDDLHEFTEEFSIARVAAVATVTRVNHGLSVGDWGQVRNAPAPFSKEFEVASVVDADNFTYAVDNSGATSAAHGTAQLHTGRVFPHSVLAAKVASQDGNYEFPPWACRLNVTAFVGGFADLTVLQT